MKLKEGIQQASKFCWKGKQTSPLSGIRFLPGINGAPSRVFANAGSVGVMIDVNIELPNVLVDGSAFEGLKEVKEITGIQDISEGVRFLCVDRKGTSYGYTVPRMDHAGFPGVPALPSEWRPVPDWWVVEQVFHAVSKDKQQPLLQCVKFSPTKVEATDRHRVARITIAGGWDGLLPIDTFAHWPKGDVEVSWSDNLVCFKVGDEVRMGVPKRGEFPDLERVFPVHEDRGYVARVDVAEMQSALKKIPTSKKQDSLTVEFPPVEGQLVLSGEGVEVNVPIDRDHDEGVVLQVSRKYMIDTFKAIETPKARLIYQHPQEPLRIESGVFCEGLWPLH